MLILPNQNTEAELRNLLSAYLMGWKTIKDCAEWFSSVDWEQININSPLAETVGQLELLCTETIENLRPESDFEIRVSDLVASFSCVRYSVPRSEIMISSSSTAATDNRSDFTVTVESPVSPFWNISPQVAPA